jgi:UTP:GlnB (protein PII) uridylyltransferase
MTQPLRRVASALRAFLAGAGRVADDPHGASPGAGAAATELAAGDNLVIARGQLSFADSARAAAAPSSWLDAFEALKARGAPLSESALGVLRSRAKGASATELLPSAADRQRLRSLLAPSDGLASALAELDRAGISSALLSQGAPASRTGPADSAPFAQALAAIRYLERLAGESSLAGERFGSLLRELRAPEVLVLALLLRGKGTPEAEEGVREALSALARVSLGSDAEEMAGFLLGNQSRMSAVAFRRDAGDPEVVSRFAAVFSLPSAVSRDLPEEHLKMLCLMTVADLGARGAASLTPWRAEVLWRLFVDTYNLITMSYGDDVIAPDEAAIAALKANRPHDILEPEMDGFLGGMPQRYLTLFDAESISQHIRLSRAIGPEDVRFVLGRKADVWELTVVTLDKPSLFSNICGVLSYLGLDILRGQALTSRGGLVLDVFQFTDHKGCLVRPQLDPLLSDVVAGRIEIGALLKSAGPPAGREGLASPLIYFDNESSPRYTILELTADDAPGLLHRISGVISRQGCGIDLILIATEGGKAFDVFHLRKGEAKLTDADLLQLTEAFERDSGGWQ